MVTMSISKFTFTFQGLRLQYIENNLIKYNDNSVDKHSSRES